MRDAISNAQKEALKAKDKTALSTICLITAALKDRDIAARTKGAGDGISDDEILSMLQTMIKQRAESVKPITKATDLNWPLRMKRLCHSAIFAATTL